MMRFIHFFKKAAPVFDIYRNLRSDTLLYRNFYCTFILFISLSIPLAEAQRGNFSSEHTVRNINQTISKGILVNSGTLPDATQDFTDYTKISDGTGRMISPDGFFILTSSDNDILDADGWGAFFNNNSMFNENRVLWMEIVVNPLSELGSFILESMIVGDMDFNFGSNNNWIDIQITGYAGEAVIAQTPQFDSFGPEPNYNVDYSIFSGLSIDRIRIDMTGTNGASFYDFNLESFTISNASTEEPEPGISIPSIVTLPASTIHSVSAILGGNIENNGGADIEEYGIVWSTTEGFDPADGHEVEMENGGDSFSSIVNLLPFETTIYYRAYATNIEGTAYGDEVSFTTENTVSAILDESEGWRMLSIPAGILLSDFLDPIWTQGEGIANVKASFGTPNVYTWSTNVDGNDKADWVAVPDLNTTLPAGRGMLVYVYQDDEPGQTGVFEKTLPLTGSEYPSGTSPELNENSEGWTLLGNPFASPIVFSQIAPSNIGITVYVWDPNTETGDGGTEPEQSTGSWKTWNGTSGDLTDGQIAPFQAFFVVNTLAGASVYFTQQSKTGAAVPFLGKRQNEASFVRLELRGNGMSNSAWLEFGSNGSFEKTEYDAIQLTPLSQQYALLATEKSDEGLLDIGRFPEFMDESAAGIPLHVSATQSGRYTLKVTNHEVSGLNHYLNDLQTGQSMMLKEGLEYEFMLQEAAKIPADPFTLLQNGLQMQKTGNHRFVISQQPLDEPGGTGLPETYVLNQNYPNPFNPTTIISYELPVSSEIRLEVFDLTGRQVTTLAEGKVNAGSHRVTFDGNNLSSGVYIYRLQAGSTLLTKKLTLIK